jgi:selenocysteine-specific elongation factor
MQPLAERGAVRHLGSTWVTRDRWEALVARATGVLDAYHLAHPLRRGIPREELRSRIGIPADQYGAALAGLIADDVMTERGGELAASDHRERLTQEQEAAARAFIAELERQPFNPPALHELLGRHPLSPAVLEYLVAEGRVIRVNDDTMFARSAYEDAVARLRAHLAQHRTLTVAAARDLLGSSRRYVLPLLEWLDAQKITRRVGDDRILRA